MAEINLSPNECLLKQTLTTMYSDEYGTHTDTHRERKRVSKISAHLSFEIIESLRSNFKMCMLTPPFALNNITNWHDEFIHAEAESQATPHTQTQKHMKIACHTKYFVKIAR